MFGTLGEIMLATYALFWALVASPLAHAAEGCVTAIVEDFHAPAALQKMRGSAVAKVEIKETGMTVALGLHLVTGTGGWADLRFCDGSAIRVGEESDFEIEQAENRGSYWAWAVQLLRGSFYGAVVGSDDGKHVKFSVRTRTASLGVRGTEFVVDATESSTVLHTLEGQVLMGSLKGWDKLVSDSWASASEDFQRVGTHSFSKVSRGDEAATKPEAFDVKEFVRRRGALLATPPRRKTLDLKTNHDGSTETGVPSSQGKSASQAHATKAPTKSPPRPTHKSTR